MDERYIKLYNLGSKMYLVRFYDTKTGVKKIYPIHPNIAPYRILKRNFTMCETLDTGMNPVNVYWNDDKTLRSFHRINGNRIEVRDFGHLVTPWTFDQY